MNDYYSKQLNELKQQVLALSRQLAALQRLDVAPSGVSLSAAQTWTALQTFSSGIRLGASADTLSDYEVGNWTCTLADATSAGNTATIGINFSTYVRIGGLVKATARCDGITTTGMTGANALVVRGFPFASANSANYRDIGIAMLANSTYSGFTTLFMANNATTANVVEAASGGTYANITVSDLTSGSANLRLTMIYQTDVT